MTDDVERYCICVWAVLTTILSVVGNVTVLIATIKYDAIKIDNMSKVLVQNIAVADLGYTLFIIIPTIFTTTTMTDTWTLGDFTCRAIGVVQFLFGIGNIIMICALNVCKLTCLLSPFASRLRSVKLGYILVSFLWFLSLLYPIQMIIFDREIGYQPVIYRCMTGDRDGTIWEILETINSGTFMLIPLLVIVITAIWLMIIICRVTSSNRQGVLVVLTVSTVFIISWTPLLSYNVFHLFSYPTDTHYKIGVFFIFINAASNPLLYLLTSKSFQEFLRKKVLGRSEVTKKSVIAGNPSRYKEQNVTRSTLATREISDTISISNPAHTTSQI